MTKKELAQKHLDLYIDSIGPCHVGQAEISIKYAISVLEDLKKDLSRFLNRQPSLFTDKKIKELKSLLKS